MIITVSRDSARMTVIRRESGPSWSRELGAAALLVGLLDVFVPVNLPFIRLIVNLALTLIGVGGLYA